MCEEQGDCSHIKRDFLCVIVPFLFLFIFKILILPKKSKFILNMFKLSDNTRLSAIICSSYLYPM